MSKALELAKFGREVPPTGLVVGDSDTQTLSAKTFSDMPVLSAGIVNGVAYLNGSKALTTSSNLIFNGTILTVSDIRDSSLTSGRVTYAGAAGNLIDSANLTFDGTTFTVGTKVTLKADAPFYTGANLSSGAHSLAIGGEAGNALIGFFVNNSEQVRLTTTGLGIGLTNPAAKLSVRTSGAQLDVSTSGTNVTFEAINRDSTNDPITMRWYARNSDFTWNTGSYFERMRLTNAGNLSLGSINNPSDPGILVSRGNNTSIILLDDEATGRGAYIRSTGSSVEFGSTSSVRPVVFTLDRVERARIDTAGNFLVGTNTLASGFSTFAQIQASGTTGGVLINSATNNIGRLMFTNNNASGGEGLIRYDGSNKSMQFWTNSNERLRITTDGDVAIGDTTASGYKLKVAGNLGVTGVAIVSSYISVGSIVANDPGSNYFSWNNRIGGGIAVQGDSYYNDSLGIGIGAPKQNSYGNTNAAQKLSIYYAAPAANTVDDVVRITSKFNASSGASALAGSGPAIVFAGGIGDNQTRDRARIAALYEGGNVSGLSFQTQIDADTIAEAMRIRNNGNVGVGTANPTSRFSVQGTTELGNRLANSQAATYNTRLSGFALRYDASNRYGSYGQLIFHADASWTSGARRWMITNGFNANTFAIIRSADPTTDIAIGDAGAISSGTADFWITNGGQVTLAAPLYIAGVAGSSLYAINIKNTDMADNSSAFDRIFNNPSGGSTSWGIVKDSIINLASNNGGHSGQWGHPVYLEAGHWRIKGSVRLSSTNGAIHGNTSPSNYPFTIGLEFSIAAGPNTGVMKWNVDTLGNGTRAAFSSGATYMAAGLYQVLFYTSGYDGIKQLYITELQLERVA